MSQPLRVNDWTVESLAAYVSEIVGKVSGNILGDAQQTMVVSRLRKRLIDLGRVTPEQYFIYLKNNYDDEVSKLVSILTTHHTFFFREFSHFDFILQKLPNIIASLKERGERELRVLCAACSRGQEVYSLAMFLNYHLEKYPGITFKVVGTDIDPESVEFAKNGVYPLKEVKPIPSIYLKGNWQRGKGNIAHFAKVKQSLKNNCEFGVMNLLHSSSQLKGQKFDLVFCRNVFIYFNTTDVHKIVNDLKEKIYDTGYFFTGLSESLKDMGLNLYGHAPSVYSFAPVHESPSVKDVKPVARAQKFLPKPIKILAVDDSPSVLKLLAKIFSNDDEFKLVGTAANGLEAAKFLKENEVDAMTLDIHMPEMDGVEYLKKYFNNSHPKVVVVSSASREDTRYAQQALKNGASDFVEKPALNNLAKRSEEIKNKLKMSFYNSDFKSDGLGASFNHDHQIKNPESKARIAFSNFSDIKKVKQFLKELRGDQPPVYLFFEGNSNYLDVIKAELELGLDVSIYRDDPQARVGRIYLCDLDDDYNDVKVKLNLKTLSVCAFGMQTQAVCDAILDLSPKQLLLEDLDNFNSPLEEVADDIFPWTSFSHLGTEFLSKE